MAEFERTENNMMYSDSIESLPIIIQYNHGNIEWNDKHLEKVNTTSEELIKKFSGEHECYFVNEGTDKNGYKKNKNNACRF